MNKLAALAFFVAAGAAAFYFVDRASPDSTALPAGVERTATADEAFVEIKYLKQDQASLVEHGFSSVASSVADYRDRALEHLGRGESERALSLARQGRELAAETLGVAAASAATATADASAPPPPPKRGGSLMTESMTAVDMTATLAGGTPRPRIRGARTKASTAAENMRTQQSRVQDQYDELDP